MAEIAAAHDGRYSLDIHLGHDRTATAAFAETHLRRLETMRRGGVGLEREPDGTWIIASDHLERTMAYERIQARMSLSSRSRPCRSTVRSVPRGPPGLIASLSGESKTATRNAGFGRDVRDALAQRRRWLIERSSPVRNRIA